MRGRREKAVITFDNRNDIVEGELSDDWRLLEEQSKGLADAWEGTRKKGKTTVSVRARKKRQVGSRKWAIELVCRVPEARIATATRNSRQQAARTRQKAAPRERQETMTKPRMCTSSTRSAYLPPAAPRRAALTEGAIVRKYWDERDGDGKNGSLRRPRTRRFG
jgi:hypothetical protein